MDDKGKGLGEILNVHFGWNKARLSCFVGMLLALIQVRTVNLVELASAMESRASVASRYKRLQRFFRHMTINLADVTSWVMTLFGLELQAIYLSMDRTNWKWGQRDINILMLSIVYKGIAWPVAWSFLSTQGNSDTEERIVLMQKWINRLGKARIAGLFGDREFIGGEWFAWLKKEGIPFCIRIKKNTLATNSRGQTVDVETLFRDVRVAEQRVLHDARIVWGHSVYLAALRLDDGQLLIVATDRLLIDPIGLYGKRWEIETLFGCLKSKGFHFEDTRLLEPARLNKLVVLLTVAFCWMHKVGEWRHEQQPIRVKKHSRKAISWFRYGLDYVRDLLLNSKSSNQDQWPALLDVLSGKIRPNET